VKFIDLGVIVGKRYLVWAVLLILGMGQFANAATTDPKIKWYTITTPHFRVIFPQKNEETARKVAAYAEEAYDIVGGKFKWHPHGKTNMVITDHNDEANGLTTVLPYKYMNIRVTSPDPGQSLHLYDNWLRTLIMHEYTHVVHLDQRGGVVTPLRYMFGSTVSPNGATPGWIREGIATLQETDTAHSHHNGRGDTTYSDMILRAAILQNDFPKIDQVSGPGWAWPGAEGQYIYGVKFLQYLQSKYGSAKLMKFNELTSHSMLFFAINHQAKRVWKKSFYKLWKEWQASIRPRYEVEAERIRQRGITELTPVTKLGSDVTITALDYSPDGKTIAYAMSSPHENPTIKLLDLETGKHRTLVRKLTANQLTFSPDGKTLYFSALALHKRYNLFRDLFAVDLEKNKLAQLTHGLRAQDPDVSPDGNSILFTTNDDGTRQLAVYDIQKKKVTVLSIAAPKYTQYSHPRWSPDGKMIVASVWQNGQRDIYLYTIKGQLARKLTDDDSIDGDVDWMKDGRHVIFSSDRSGVSNLYIADVFTGETRQLSNVLTGVFSAAPAPDEKSAVAMYYTGKGYKLMRLDIPNINTLPIVDAGTKSPKGFGKSYVVPMNQQKVIDPDLYDEDTEGEQTGLRQKSEGSQDQKSGQRTGGAQQADTSSGLPFVPEIKTPKTKYNPLKGPLLLPHYLSPFFSTLDNGVIFGGITGSSDPLNRHSWQAGINYRTDSDHLGFSGSYTYSRWRPQFTLNFVNYSANMGFLTFNEGGTLVTKNIYEARNRGSVIVAYPFKQQSIAFMYSFEHRNSISRPALLPQEDTLLNFGRFAGPQIFYVFSNVEKTKAAISGEKGTRIRAMGVFNNTFFGTLSDNVQEIFGGDIRQYIPMPWLHHVLAFRLGGGIAFNQQLVQGTFTLGGSLGEGQLSAGGDSMYYFPLRGLPVASLSRSRALLLSSEYRMPLMYVQRGLGTMPFYFNTLHLAFFADYGNAWNKNESLGGYAGFGNFMLGTGAELRADITIGHGLPIFGRLGYAIIVVNRDRIGGLTDNVLHTSADYGTAILQLGTSF